MRYAKHRLSKFKGIKKENFLILLKETEFKYKASSSIEMSKIQQQDLYKILLKLIRNQPLKLDWAFKKFPNVDNKFEVCLDMYDSREYNAQAERIVEKYCKECQ